MSVLLRVAALALFATVSWSASAQNYPTRLVHIIAPFGPGASYPTDARSFRVELVAKEGRWTLTGKCLVGPSG